MRMRSPQLVAFSLVLIFSASVAAFELLDPPRRWFPDDVSRTVIVDEGGLDDVTLPDPDGGVTAAMGAIEAWGTSVVQASSGSPAVGLGDGLSHLVFGDPFNVCKGRCLAATLTGFFDDSQVGTCDGLSVVRITDSDIFLNTKGHFAVWTSEGEDPGGVGCAGEVYVETVVTHEVGHVIGLAHDPDPSVLMSASIGACDNMLLQTDDEQGRDELYACTSFASCGDDSCDSGETLCNCPADCGAPLLNELGMCQDTVDNDCDLCIDVIDSDCGGIEVSCAGGVDDDCDGFVDCDDADCSADLACAECELGTKGDGCGIDDDCCSGKCRGRPGSKTCK